MASVRSKSVRCLDDLERAKLTSPEKGHFSRFMNMINVKQEPELGSKKGEKTFRKKVLSRVYSEDYETVEKAVLDPRGPLVNRWNKIFLVACLISLFVDPLFFYLPRIEEDFCISVSKPLEFDLTTIRSLIDVFYIIQIFVRFQTAYIAPSSCVFGRGELVIDPIKIASGYLHRDFWLDIVAAQPLPQVLVWAVIPRLEGSMAITRHILRLIIIFQYLLRLYLIFPLSSQITEATGVVTETAWAGAAYNLMLYMLASHVIGACWYLLASEQQEKCWREVCNHQAGLCHDKYFDCSFLNGSARAAWFQSSNISSLCSPGSNFYQFGIYADALDDEVTSAKFFNKYFYCLWWGLRNLSSLGQNLLTSTYIGEISFAIIIATLGLVLFALLIGNMQKYLQSTTVRLEEWRIKRTDTEKWMQHRQLPHELKQRVRRYEQYKWLATRGVDEEAILKSLPIDLRRDIKLHLCLELVRRVPLFDLMDDRQMLDAICERLKPCLCTPGTCLVREGDPVNEMFFIVRGHLDSYTTNGGQTGFFNSCWIGPGDFCGEELLTWALDPRPSIVLPSSTRTVKAITEVEAFDLVSEDLKFVASQFRRLNSKQLRHTFRFHSHQWRKWAACFIQAAWFRYKRRQDAMELRKRESMMTTAPEPGTGQTGEMLPPAGSSLSSYAAKLATSIRRGGSMRCGTELDILTSLQKPKEPDFSIEGE
ncbi:hypothetical protein SLA2020_007990 [Shorea laevis]